MKKFILIPVAGLALAVGACSNGNHQPSQHIVVTHVYQTPKPRVTIHKHVTVHVHTTAPKAKVKVTRRSK